MKMHNVNAVADGYNVRGRILQCYTSAKFPETVRMARIEVKSEITGTVWQVKSQPGDKVESGDVLMIVESMKMEIPVITEDGGVVREILVQKKDPVAEGQVVAVLED
jgi:acetyl-CoA carboxylase biotin carboxyl carrier protein